MEFDDGDLMSIVLSCGRGKKPAVSTPATATAAASMTAADPVPFHLVSAPPPPHPMFPPLLPPISPPPPPPPSLFPLPFGGLEDISTPFLSHFSPQPRLHDSLLLSTGSPEPIDVESALRRWEVSKTPVLPDQKQKTKKRKCSKPTQQLHKVTVHVPADRRAYDNWAWRKYGQKPIKGSPYPRGYYRCSTIKECPARKLVEKSSSNPSIFVITYSGEHIHAFPTHRTSLTGCTRNSSPSGLSPTTPLAASPVSADEDEDEEEATLHVDDMEIVGPDDQLLFLGDASAAPETSTVNSGFFDVEDDPFFASLLWNNNGGDATI